MTAEQAGQLALGVDPLQDALAWAIKNPEAWEFIIALAHDDRARGIAPSTRYYCCVLRRPEHAARLGLRRCSRSLLVNDHLSSGLARLLNRRYPDLGCPTRDSWAEKSERRAS